MGMEKTNGHMSHETERKSQRIQGGEKSGTERR